MSRKTLDRFFILLHHRFYSCKPQIHTEQTGSIIRFAIPQKNLCSCIQKIKNKHDGGADVAFFVSACNTHSLVERLSALTVLLGNKDKDSITVKIYKRRLQQPHSQGNTYCKMKEEITSQKKLFKVKKKMWQRRTRDLCFYFVLLIYNRFLLQVSLFFFFPWLIINHKHKCIPAKTFATQVSWSFDSCTH